MKRLKILPILAPEIYYYFFFYINFNLLLLLFFFSTKQITQIISHHSLLQYPTTITRATKHRRKCQMPRDQWQRCCLVQVLEPTAHLLLRRRWRMRQQRGRRRRRSSTSPLRFFILGLFFGSFYSCGIWFGGRNRTKEDQITEKCLCYATCLLGCLDKVCEREEENTILFLEAAVGERKKGKQNYIYIDIDVWGWGGALNWRIRRKKNYFLFFLFLFFLLFFFSFFKYYKKNYFVSFLSFPSFFFFVFLPTLYIYFYFIFFNFFFVLLPIFFLPTNFIFFFS